MDYEILVDVELQAKASALGERALGCRHCLLPLLDGQNSELLELPLLSCELQRLSCDLPLERHDLLSLLDGLAGKPKQLAYLLCLAGSRAAGRRRCSKSKQEHERPAD